MTDAKEALARAREAHDRATEALRTAEAAVRAAGVEVAPHVVDELTVKQIRVVEDDGTPRLLIGNGSVVRTIPVRGVEHEHPGRSGAGLLFVNDEGTECGGLMSYGVEGEQFLRLSFDGYEQNDALIVGHHDESGTRQSVLEFVDRPHWSIADLIEEASAADGDEARRAVSDRYFADGAGESRMRLAREEDGSVGLTLRDGRGRDRLRLVVPEEGEPRVELVALDGTAHPLTGRPDVGEDPRG